VELTSNNVTSLDSRLLTQCLLYYKEIRETWILIPPERKSLGGSSPSPLKSLPNSRKGPYKYSPIVRSPIKSLGLLPFTTTTGVFSSDPSLPC